MASRPARVEPAGPDQPDLHLHAEHCSAAPELLARLGRRRGQQVRVRTTGTPAQVAVFTVSQSRRESDPRVVRVGAAGRRRLGPGEGTLEAVLDPVVVRSALSDEEAARLGEFVERLADDGRPSGLVVLAPHGGQIEPHTDVQALRVATRLSGHQVTFWCCKGFGPGPGDAGRRFHITTTELDEAGFPALRSLGGRRFDHAVAFHGQQAEGILIGGRAPFRLRAELASAIEEAISGSGIPVRIAEPGDRFGGDSPRNLVNRITIGGLGGVHLEQGPLARLRHGADIADAVAQVFGSRVAAAREPGSSAGRPGSSASRPRRPSWWRTRRAQRDDGR